MSLWPKRPALNKHPALFMDVFCCWRCVLPGLPKFWVRFPIIYRDYMLHRWYWQPCVTLVQKRSKSHGSSLSELWRTFKSRSVWKWCFASNGPNGEMSRLYKLLGSALPYQQCQEWGNSNCSWAGDGQILLQKSLSPLSCHPAPATSGPGTHPQTTATLLCPFHGRVEPLAVEDMFRNAFKLDGWCPQTERCWVCLKQFKSCLKPKAEMWLSG